MACLLSPFFKIKRVENNSICDGLLIWVSNDRAHCMVTKEFDCQKLGLDLTTAIAHKLRSIPRKRHLPLIIHLTDVNVCDMIQLFHFFSPCSRFSILVPTRMFLVRSFFHKWLLGFFCILTGNAFWNTVYSNRAKAFRDSKSQSMHYNLVEFKPNG